MQFTTRKVKTTEDIATAARLADEIWHQHFTPIIGADQVEYMLDQFQDQEAMTDQIAHSTIYLLALADDEPIGYCACKPEEDRLFLSKLYLRQSMRGKGFGRKLLEAACALGTGKRAVYLTVNKHNDNTIAIYRKLGFSVIDSVVSDIGNGFVMDDYIMEKPL